VPVESPQATAKSAMAKATMTSLASFIRLLPQNEIRIPEIKMFQERRKYRPTEVERRRAKVENLDRA
jgi:hypothetical protein